MHKPKQLILEGEIVKQSNEIARSQLKFKIDSKNKVICGRIIATVAARIHIDDDDFKSYTFPASTVLSANNIGGYGYAAIDAATDDLMTAYFVRRYTTETGKKAFEKLSLFSSIKYENGQITAKFSPEVKKHFLNLHNNFSQYGLIEYLMLTSRYSQKLFEVLASWKNAKEVVLGLDDLFFALDVPLTLQRYNDFRRFVLIKAQNDLNTYTNLDFEWEPIKEGRAVTKIRFIFGKKRIAEHNTKQKDAKQKKQSIQNNKLFLSVTNCRRKKGIKPTILCNKPDCSAHQKKLCQEMFNQPELI